MDALGQACAMRANAGPIPFQTKGRISHHLMFISKHPLGSAEIMKGVMSGESTLGMFGYDQAAEKQPLLFQDLPVEALARELLERFAGKTIRFSEIGVERHPPTRPASAQTGNSEARVRRM